MAFLPTTQTKYKVGKHQSSLVDGAEQRVKRQKKTPKTGDDLTLLLTQKVKNAGLTNNTKL